MFSAHERVVAFLGGDILERYGRVFPRTLLTLYQYFELDPPYELTQSISPEKSNVVDDDNRHPNSGEGGEPTPNTKRREEDLRAMRLKKRK